MLQPKYFAQLRGTSKGQELVHFNNKTHFEVAQRIAKEFGFEFFPIPATENKQFNKSTYYQYPHEFRVYCCRERHDKLGGFKD